MTTKERFGLAVAQLGPIHLNDSRESAVARLMEMMREAASRGAKLVVFPELALTTFFPRYWMSEEEAEARFFEASMPGPATQPLFDLAKSLGIGFYLGYAERTEDGRRFNTSILVDGRAKIVGRYRKIHLPGHSDHKPDAPFQHLEKKFFVVGNDGFGVWPMLGTNVVQCICNDRRWPEIVLSRGRVVVRDNVLNAERGSGRYIARGKPEPMQRKTSGPRQGALSAWTKGINA